MGLRDPHTGMTRVERLEAEQNGFDQDKYVWRQKHLQNRVDSAGLGIQAAKAHLDRARTARESGQAGTAANWARRAATERGIAFRHGQDTARIAQDYGMQVPPRSADVGAFARPSWGDQQTPVNKSRGRRSWMPGKGLG